MQAMSLITVILVLIFSQLTTITNAETIKNASTQPISSEKTKTPTVNSELNEELIQIEEQASKIGQQVLSTGREMTLINQEIIRGGCWHYAEAVYQRAGFPRQQREVVFNQKKHQTPYAERDLIQPGDWLHYINHGYKGVEHSAIFVKWLNEKEALMLSYGGERRNKPARYKRYDLSSVYRIVRGVEQ